MKKTILKNIGKVAIMTLLFFSVQTAYAQGSAGARKVLDKTASVFERQGGISASFNITSFNGSQLQGGINGNISIKGNKFHASTANAIVWFDGKTEWTYMKKNDEVNVNNPTEAQLQSMNPYNFITMYKRGFNYSMVNTTLRGKSAYDVHLTAQNKSREIQEVLITIDKTSYQPMCVRMRKGAKQWTVISIRDFKSQDLSDNIFKFNQKDFPKAEVIDLR